MGVIFFVWFFVVGLAIRYALPEIWDEVPETLRNDGIF
jgi:hypothetical protein